MAIRSHDVEANERKGPVCGSLPVHYTVRVKVEQAQRNLRCIEYCDRLFKLPLVLYSIHEISSVHVLHHKVQPLLSQ